MIMKRYYWINLLLVSMFMLIACNEDENEGFGPEGVRVDVPQIIEMTNSETTVSASFAMQDGLRYTDVGFCYSADDNPTIYDAAVQGTVSNGVVTATLNTSNCYIRAFVSIYEGDIVYSEAVFVGESGESEQ